AIIGRALGPEDEKVFALLRKLFDLLLQINSAPIYVVQLATDRVKFWLAYWRGSAHSGWL
ncbi:MAG: hypothetical protein ACLFUS_17265, partial [Candidatus Sumerlaeia bacterium]